MKCARKHERHTLEYWEVKREDGNLWPDHTGAAGMPIVRKMSEVTKNWIGLKSCANRERTKRNQWHELLPAPNPTRTRSSTDRTCKQSVRPRGFRCPASLDAYPRPGTVPLEDSSFIHNWALKHTRRDG